MRGGWPAFFMYAYGVCEANVPDGISRGTAAFADPRSAAYWHQQQYVVRSWRVPVLARSFIEQLQREAEPLTR